TRATQDPAASQFLGSSAIKVAKPPLFLVGIGELFEALAAGRLTELQQAAGLDLADALAGDAIQASHLVERFRSTVLEAEAELDHFAFARGQALEHFVDAVLQQACIDMFAGCIGLVIAEEILEGPFAVAAD